MRNTLILLTLMLLWPTTAQAQTWVGGRTTPALVEIVAIDATGEDGWPYGFEDLAGDDADFKQQEQSIDIRTAYATTGGGQFWIRTYVSDPNSAGGNVTVFVFIDSETGGGSAAASELDPKFVSDDTTGGYDYVIQVGGNGSLDEIWQWQGNQFQPTDPQSGIDAEADQDADPIEINGIDHGYIQGMVDLDLVGLTPACLANLYVRSVHNATGGDGDLEVGTVAPCIPADENGDDVPDLLEPPTPCITDIECPGGGICVDGHCLVPPPCLTDADCDPDEECTDDQICLPVPGGDCDDNGDCDNGLVCRNGVCSPCLLGGSECGPGMFCGPDGRCHDGTYTGSSGSGGAGGGGLFVDGEDRAQGGAFTCAIGSGWGRSGLALLALAIAFVTVSIRRARRPL
ncbi:MAG: hypothetical protein JRI68_18500 [Deltaproteobacteria bacterium]|nr:hypothetical protein [Deltaproteobacteria bacterium]